MKTVKEILVDARNHLARVGLHHGDFFEQRSAETCREGRCCALGAIRVGAEEAPTLNDYPPRLLRCAPKYNDMVRAANLVGKAAGTGELVFGFGLYFPSDEKLIRYDIPRWNDDANLTIVLAAFDAAIAAAPED
jgi:hypothetical protein